MKIKIHAVHFDADQKLESFITTKMDKLDQYYDNIINADVYLRIDKSDSNDNKVAEIKIHIPGNELFVKKQSKSFEESTDTAVEALRRQVKKHKEKLRNH